MGYGVHVSRSFNRPFATWRELMRSIRLVVIPLSFLRRLDSLKYTSVIALISIGYLVILVLAHFIKGDTLEDRGHISVLKWQGPIPTLAAFPVIVFAYTCHQNVRLFPYYAKSDSLLTQECRCFQSSMRSATTPTFEQQLSLWHQSAPLPSCTFL